MTGTSWLIDSKRIASKIKNASETLDSSRSKWKSNPSKACPRCKHVIDNTDVAQEWPGLPRGVKFDPSDQELLWHLLAKAGKVEADPHPFINEFIPTVDEDDGICYTHPQKLPGVKQDGSVSHFFHRTFKAYNTGTRKRRKINGDLGDVRWHKTGKTKPVIIDGQHLGCKKIMVLYMSPRKGHKPEKTNWVMHQYHLGTGEDEQDGQFVVSKVFFQQQQSKPNDKCGRDSTPEIGEEVTMHSDPVSVPALETSDHLGQSANETFEQGHSPNETFEQGHSANETFEQGDKPNETFEHGHSPNEAFEQVELYYGTTHEDNNTHHDIEKLLETDTREDEHNAPPESEIPGDQENKWWEGESQFLLDSQQLAEGIALCDEFLQSQSSCIDDEGKSIKPRLADYAQMDVDHLKKDLEECKEMGTLDHANFELDATPDFRLSQLEFGSQDSFLPFAGSKLVD